ncbi:MAG: peptidylprolyl isomerase [Peptococcaceae bacterium]|nr:peptidylprolyl isomerase [Peptococcaceae bacterium]
MKKALSVLLVTVMTAGLLAGCSSASDDMGGEDVIKVNDTALTKNYVDARVDMLFQQNQLQSDDSFAGYFKGQIISGLVEAELMVQESKNRGFEVTDDDIDTYKKDLIAQTYGGSEDDFQAYLDEYNVSDAMLKRMIEEKLYYDKLLADIQSGVTVDAEAYYNENTDQFDVDDQVDAKHILVDDEETAKDIIKQLDDGADFSKLAAKYSTDAATAQKGGELGYFSANEMVTEFSDAAFALEPGQYTKEPVKTSYGYHVILCEDKKAAHHQSFEEVKDELTEQLTNQEVQTEYASLMSELKSKATIEYLSDDYNPDKLIEEAQAQMAEESKSDDAANNDDSNTADSSAASENTDAAASNDSNEAAGEALVDTEE